MDSSGDNLPMIDHETKSDATSHITITPKRAKSGPPDAEKNTPTTKKRRFQGWIDQRPPSDGHESIYTSTDGMTLEDVFYCLEMTGRHARVGFPNDGTFVADCRATQADRRGKPFSKFMRCPSSLNGGFEIIHDVSTPDVAVNVQATQVFQSVLTDGGPLYGPVYLTFSPSLAAMLVCREMSRFIQHHSRAGLCHGLAPWARVGMVNFLTHPAMDSLTMDAMDNICSLLEHVTRDELESRHQVAVNYLARFSYCLDDAPAPSTLMGYLLSTYPNRGSIRRLLEEVLVVDVTHAVYEYLGMCFDVRADMPAEIFRAPASGIVTRQGLLPEPPFDNALCQMETREATREARAILSGFRWESIHNYRVFHDYLVHDMLKLLTERRCPRSFIWRVKARLLRTKNGRKAHPALWGTMVHLHRLAQTTRGGWQIMPTIKFESMIFLHINLDHPPERALSSLLNAHERVSDSATINISYRLPLFDQGRRGPSPDDIGDNNGWHFVEHAPNGVFFTRADIVRVIVDRFKWLYLRNWNDRFGPAQCSPAQCHMFMVSHIESRGYYTFDYDIRR